MSFKNKLGMSKFRNVHKYSKGRNKHNMFK